MNVADDILAAPAAPRAVAAIPPLQTFKMLLRREFWEHRGGFFWAPVITGLVAIVFSLFGVVASSIMLQSAIRRGDVHMDGVNINVSGHESAFGLAGDIALLSGMGLACVVFVFVVFFYALGSIYDERKDRSILFWKSLPVSDTQAVLSKLLWALVLAPVLAIGIGLAIGAVMWLLSWVAVLLNGVPGASGVFTEAHPLRLVLQILCSIPVYALWALPTVGWLMLCSAWARSVPFVWAVVIPLLACMFISWLDILPGIEIPHDAIWYTVAFRGLLSIVPGSWYLSPQINGVDTNSVINGPEDIARSIDFTSSLQAFATVDLWIGAVLGALMVYTAIRLRRWRDEG
ncbi:ABC transporter permease [Lysobacter sp. ESA13C]|uniref:ABC transporter permease n=1 Tax=Lysobacter sp. ESA13C TaxID=2862676 RepID=UPI001CC12417|nr:ABC transporter permease [Lysobacter sp. ESA13C]